MSIASVTFWGNLSGLVGAALVWLGRYAVFEKVCAALVARRFVTMVGAAALTLPNLGELLRGLVPTMPAEMMEMWFGKTFNREGLDAKTRLLLTIGALTVQGALAEPQLRLAVRHARQAGATQREIAETIFQMSVFGGLPAMQKALELAQSVFAEEEDQP